MTISIDQNNKKSETVLNRSVLIVEKPGFYEGIRKPRGKIRESGILPRQISGKCVSFKEKIEAESLSHKKANRQTDLNRCSIVRETFCRDSFPNFFGAGKDRVSGSELEENFSRMKNREKDAFIPRFPWLKILFLLLFPQLAFCADFEQGFALRQILELQQWPAIFSSLNGDFQRNSFTFQGLTRFWIKKKFGNASLNFEIENNGLVQSNPLQQKGVGGSWNDQNADSSGLEFMDLSGRNSSREKSRILTTIERMDFTWSMGKWDFDFGRQPVSLGTSHFLGILDILSPFHPGYLDSSYKPGIDAFRMRTGMGTAGEAEIIAVPTRPWRNRALVGRFRNNFKGFDLELVTGRFRERNMAGIGYDGERNKITYWGEIAFFERKLEKEKIRSGNSSFALSWISGCEKEVGPKLRLGLAIMHQDFGVGDSEKLVQVYSDAPFKEGWAFLGGRTYGLVTLSKEFTPLMKGDLSGILNANDRSTLWQPKLTFNTGDNSDISVFSWLGTGNPPSFSGMGVSTPGEFGLFPCGLGVIARQFF